MRRDAAFVAVLAVVIIVVTASCAVYLREEVHTVSVDAVEIHPENELRPEGLSFTSDAGNYISPYIHVRMSGDIIEIEFTTVIDPADDYVIESMTCITEAPYDMLVPVTGHYGDGPEGVVLFVGDAFFLNGTRDIDSSVDTVTFYGSYASDPPTITGPLITLEMKDQTPSPITCEYSFRFVDPGLLEDRVELINGSFTIILDEYLDLLP